MKLFIVLCVVASAIAEPPRFRPSRFRFQRQELAPTTTDSPTEATTEEVPPYRASGWQPDVPFNLPKQEIPPSDAYGAPRQAPYAPSGWKPEQPFTLPNEAPANTYGAPDTSYGVPDNTYGAPEAAEPTTDNPEAENLEGVEVQKSSGEYYLLLPNGELQKVEFMTENDVQNMAYTARLRVRDSAPLYVFRP